LPPAANNSYTLLSHSPFTDFNHKSDYANSSIYQVASGAWVFGAGSIYWSWGLDNYVPPSAIGPGHTVADPRIQQTVANILNTFISGTPPSQSIAPPSNLTASAVSSSEIDLSWIDNSTNEDNFVLERSGDSNFTSVNAITLPVNTTSYADTGLSAGTYYYRVKATNAGGSSAYSDAASAATLPAAPSNLAAVAVSSTQVDLSWTDNSTNEAAYTVERSKDNAAWTVLTSALPPDAAFYSDTSVGPLTTYYYRIKATNASGASAYSNTTSATTPNGPPASPTNLNATRSGNANRQSINLSWTDNATNETAYIVERSQDKVTWTVLTGLLVPNTTSYTDKNQLQRSTTYYYRVKATNSLGSSGYSNVASATTR